MKRNIDILVPCYNSELYLHAMIRSIQSQTYDNFRVIFVDNDSQDQTLSIIESFDDSRFVVRKHTQHVPLVSNFNRCLEYAETEIFSIWHTDDIYHEDFLERMLHAFLENPETDLACCNTNIIDDKQRKNFRFRNIMKKNKKSNQYKIFSGIDGLFKMSDYCRPITPSIVYKKSCVDKIGCFEETFPFCMDWDYYIRALKAGLTILHVNETLMDYRIHTNHETHSCKKSLVKYEDMKRVIDDACQYMNTHFQYRKPFKYKYLQASLIGDALLDLKNNDLKNFAKKILWLKNLF